MSPRYENADVDEVLARADIIEIIGEHVKLKRAGRSFKGLCPFHQERTPSFTVDREKGVYYCFGCNAGGSVFRFVMEVEGLTFPEAVDSLARRYGVELREVARGDRRDHSPRARLQALMTDAVAMCRAQLESRAGREAREYLAERGFDEEVREQYRLGFGGWDRGGLVRALVRKGYTAEEAVSSGMATREGRSLRDTFHGRVLFPIFDAGDHPIGFGGRVLPEQFRRPGAPEGPKYLNSRESPLFKKSRVLYATNWARGDVVREKRLVLVEGYTDVIAVRRAGIGETVATCGTSLTEQHMHEISRRFGDVRVVLCLDADAAGQAAMSRGRTEELASAYAPGESVAGAWLPVGRGWLPEVFVARLPQGLDPADFAQASGREGLAEVLGDAIPLAEFMLRRALSEESTSTPEGRARAVHRGAEVLAQVGDSLLRHEYALWLADRAGVDSYEVVKAVEERASRGAPAQRTERRVVAPTPAGPARIEREVLRALVNEPELFDSTDTPISESDLTDPLHRALYRLLRAEWDRGEGLEVSRLLDRVQDDALRRAVSELSMGDPGDEAVRREVLVRLKELAIGRDIESTKSRLRQLDSQREAAAHDALFEQLVVLEKHRRALRERM